VNSIFGVRFGPGFESAVTVVVVESPDICTEMLRIADEAMSISHFEMQRRKLVDLPTNIANLAGEIPRAPEEQEQDSKGRGSRRDSGDDSIKRFTEEGSLTLCSAHSGLSVSFKVDPSKIGIIAAIELVMYCYQNNVERWTFVEAINTLLIDLASRDDVLLVKASSPIEEDEGQSHRMRFHPRDKEAKRTTKDKEDDTNRRRSKSHKDDAVNENHGVNISRNGQGEVELVSKNKSKVYNQRP